jgi:hypothetical protein
MRAAVGGNAAVIAAIAAGQRYADHGRDVTAEKLADARRRLADAEGALANA